MRAATLAALVGTLAGVHGAPIDPYDWRPKPLPAGVTVDQDIGPYGARLAVSLPPSSLLPSCTSSQD